MCTHGSRPALYSATQAKHPVRRAQQHLQQTGEGRRVPYRMLDSSSVSGFDSTRREIFTICKSVRAHTETLVTYTIGPHILVLPWFEP